MENIYDQEAVVTEEQDCSCGCEETAVSDEAPREHDAAVIQVEPETKSKVGFVLAAIVVLCVILAGVFVINNTPMKRLCGAWNMHATDRVYMFTAEEEVFINGMYYGTYTATSDLITITGDGEEEGMIFEYRYDGDMLVLTNRGDVDTMYAFGYSLDMGESLVLLDAVA